jgi:hypothetical protein
MRSDASPASDPRALIRSAQYRSLLVLAAAVGLVVSTAAWLFLESVHEIEVWVYQNLPHHAGYATAPEWWPTHDDEQALHEAATRGSAAHGISA